MRIAVIGAGIVGVTTAYELTQDGHAVQVFDRCSSVAAETSFANAGVIAPGYVAPLAAPGLPGLLWRQIWSGDPALRLRPGADAAAWRWLWRTWRACHAPQYRANRAALMHLSTLTQQRLAEITLRLQISFEQSSGLLVLLPDEPTLVHAQRNLPLMRELGIDVREISADEARVHEPALHTSAPLAGIWQLPRSDVANCRQVAHLLKEAAESQGATFHFGTEVLRIAGGAHPTIVTRTSTQADRTSALSISPASRHDSNESTLEPREHHFDAVVLCAGADSARLLSAVGMKLPMQPVFGYAISAPVRDPEHAPVSAVIDERHKITISRMGSRVRVAGCAELGGDREHLRPHAIAMLHKVLNDRFPGAARLSQMQTWKGARAMLPDGPPLIGRSPQAGIWLNVGHGSSGWALSCGSARVLADLIAGRAPSVDVARFRLGRWNDTFDAATPA